MAEPQRGRKNPEIIVQDFLTLLFFDKNGKVGDAPLFEVSEDALSITGTGVSFAKKEINNREWQILISLLNKRIKPTTTAASTANDAAEFDLYCGKAREKFIAHVEVMKPLLSSKNRVEIEDLIICFDQMRERLKPLPQATPLSEEGKGK